eukprot:gb/GFBE01006182.1/.p1 GENE.gb/GFBE01006182.1/~~gb/GFBE01006182.1/.p1  ORF type:complete len:141 (+),score=32.60 gb/GFBE01006182.1/:1-423(+)
METLLDIEDEHMKDLGVLPGHQVKLKKRLDEWEEDVPLVTTNVRPVPVTVRPTTSVAVSRGNVGSAPTDKMITSVKMSWAHLQEIGTEVVGEFFYKKLFELNAETKRLFPMSVRRRYRDWANDEEEDEHDPNNSPALRRL